MILHGIHTKQCVKTKIITMMRGRYTQRERKLLLTIAHRIRYKKKKENTFKERLGGMNYD